MALLPFEQALARVLEGASRLGVERVPVVAAAGRVLAQDLQARFTQPPFPSSAMDGYAVRAADAATPDARLRVIGAAQAGRGFAGTVGTGEAVRIFTGAPVPAGADAVIIQEDVTALDGSIIVREPLSAEGEHVRVAGVDFKAGDAVLKAGRRLDAHAVALAAAMGYGDVDVARRPRIALLATGDELVSPGAIPGPDQIVSSNPVGLRALLEAHGAEVVDLGIAADRREEIAAKIDEAHSAEVLVTIGGASVGDHDLIGPVLKDKGIELGFWKIALRPGKPMLFARHGAQRVVGLPGNPVSALLTARLFLLPLVSALMGEATPPRIRDRAVLTQAIASNGPRLHLLRGKLSSVDGGLAATPFSSQDSSLLTILADADCLIVRAPYAPAAAAGEAVEIERL